MIAYLLETLLVTLMAPVTAGKRPVPMKYENTAAYQ